MVEKWLELLKQGNCISEKDVKSLCERIKEILIEESNVQPISSPVVIAGDIHGQYYDLLELFKTGGDIPYTKYLFLGDYVDRGYNSVETLELLLALKLKYPSHITLLRGNHESRQISYQYGFYDEIMRKYGNMNCWKYFTELFDYFPLAAIIEGKLFCIHGGLSPEISTIDQIRLINRKTEIPHQGPYADLLWSDPDNSIETFHLSERNAGHTFGWKPVYEFNHLNNLELVCRAHQLVMEGFKFWFDRQNLVTIWSAPNYVYRCGNKASILKIDYNLEKSFEIFSSSIYSSLNNHPKSQVPYFL